MTRVEAIIAGNLGDVFWFGEFDIHTIVQSGAMLGRLNDLDRSMIAWAHADVGRQRDLWQADRARIRVIGRAVDLEGRDHGVAHIRGHRSQTQVDVDERCRMTLEPARLESDRTAADGPFSSVG